jgi:integrase
MWGGTDLEARASPGRRIMETPKEKPKKRRRGRGEGSIYERKDGRFAGVVNVGFRNGKRVRKTFYGETRGEVQEELKKALREQQQNLPVAPDKQTTGDFLSAWLVGTAKPRLRARTFKDYEKIVNKHLIPALGKVPLTRLGPEHVMELLRSKSEEGLSPRRVRVIRAVLHTAIDEAFAWGRLARNVVDLVKAPRATRYQAAVLDERQAKALLKAATKHRLGAVFSVAVAIGLRLGEALGLRWDDVDLNDRTLTVRQALQRVDGKLQFVEPKSEKSRRTVPLPDVAVTALKRHRTRQKREQLKAGGDWQASGLVFTSTIGSPLDERNVRRAFKEVRDSAKPKLPKMRIHDLRHTCATLLLAQGVHPKVVQEILGHSQISLTMDTYSTVLPTVSRAAAEQMDAALRAG